MSVSFAASRRERPKSTSTTCSLECSPPVRSMMLSGFTSRCAIRHSCVCSTPSPPRIPRMIHAASSSLNRGVFRADTNALSVVPCTNSITSAVLSGSPPTPSRWLLKSTMLGCRPTVCKIRDSRPARGSPSFCEILIATRSRPPSSIASQTAPCAPSPSRRSNSNPSTAGMRLLPPEGCSEGGRSPLSESKPLICTPNLSLAVASPYSLSAVIS
mmetsp:Transcript_16970/g.40924  ORF Transcript_16970/g.40924 Transcript_16970/m.40924 type:complete len:214 (+) Transcript_16970:1456-2097(+)